MYLCADECFRDEEERDDCVKCYNCIKKKVYRVKCISIQYICISAGENVYVCVCTYEIRDINFFVKSNNAYYSFERII